MNIGIVGGCNPNAFSNYFSTFDVNSTCIFPNAPSVETYVIGLLRQGYYVRIFSSHISGPSTVHYYGEKIDYFSIRRRSEISSPVLGLFKTAKNIRKLLSEKIDGLDVLHAQWTYEYAYACLNFTDKLPVFCTVRDWAPFIWSTLDGYFKRTRILWMSKLIIWKKVLSCKKMHFIANSEYTRSMLETKIDSKIAIIYNPIDSHTIIKERHSYPNEPIYISISVNLSERKNYYTLLKAFHLLIKKIPNAKLILCGGQFINSNIKIKHWYREGLMKNVILCGKVAHHDLFKYLDSSTILVHPSLEETFGNTLIEAMARKVLCIGGEKSGAVPMVLGNGRYGLLCDVTDENSLCNMMELAYTDKDKFIKITNDATDKLLKMYDETIIVKKHIDLYTSLISKL